MNKYIFLYRILPQITELTRVCFILLCYAALTQKYKTECHERYTDVLHPVIEPFTEEYKCSQGLENTRYTVPHTVDPQDVALFEGSDEEIDDPSISDETAAKIRELVLACKELELKVTKYLEYTGHDNIKEAHSVSDKD